MIDYNEIRDVARADGLVAALLLLHLRCGGDPVYGPAGHAVLPASIAGDEPPLLTLDLYGDTLVAVRGRGVPSREWSLGLAWLRLGLSEGLLGRCLSYLGARTAGDSPLLVQQLVKGQLAEAVTEHLLIQGVLHEELAAEALDDLHLQITLADRMLLRLLGGSGFRADGPGQSAHVSELLADAYTGTAEVRT
ncbi:hypothetical protein SAMN05216276_1012181 [Streptosporangium subroseum]|uniref:Acyl-CoA dehydrogenase, C-terminal domain n=1 Tax=Streptosporangium subroseum TaxID=106412 RepID=A0A239G0L8_9ACTN|nr:hypothetical protein [Streptosporangium subroseum]SNS62679.1 hypothetical protein SAMN05216276_1012181 [Streptosporangium subroseum]